MPALVLLISLNCFKNRLAVETSSRLCLVVLRRSFSAVVTDLLRDVIEPDNRTFIITHVAGPTNALIIARHLYVSTTVGVRRLAFNSSRAACRL